MSPVAPECEQCVGPDNGGACKPAGCQVLSQQHCFDALIRVVRDSSSSQDVRARDFVAVLAAVADKQWPQAGEGQATEQQQQQQQQQAVVDGAQPLVLQQWHVQSLAEAVRIAFVGHVWLSIDVLGLLERIVCSSVGSALLMAPRVRALCKTAELPGELQQVEWQQAHPQDNGSVLGSMQTLIDAGPAVRGVLRSIAGKVRAAYAVVRAERLPEAWFELREAVVRFAAALSRLSTRRHAFAAHSGGAKPWGGLRCGGGVQGSAAARQQLASALDALAASSSAHHGLQQQLMRCE
ncbi:hypothetical protein OEZ86_004805 [Tetradesmus obliquus]|nr:hypothetical protein OEZ86_004805 [Tetradesmus obliquus]